MPEIVKTDVGETGLLQEWSEVPLTQFGRIYRTAGISGEDQSLISVEVPQTLHLLYLTPQV